MEAISFVWSGTYPPEAIKFRFCPKDPGNHWRVEGERCPVCRSKIKEVRYEPVQQEEN
jgi:hypothetical protein